ncbi:MAG: trypsin-like peptidase domain-containing protein [Actinobacteria bacterium]|nr:trypsin-like peptidase domain-containing protein [Actinomycetota bacterium]
MRSVLRSPLVAALVGGAVVAVALLLVPGVGREGSTTTVVQQAPVASPSSEAAHRGQAAAAEQGLTAHDIYERDAPGVVHVRSVLRASAGSSPFGGAQGTSATGTGFVIDGDGHILTNFHVVEDATSVSVGFDDNRVVPARVLGTDATNDLALLQVEPGGLKLSPLQLGDSSTAQVGDPVLAIGNPFGLDRTLTTGVVSALQREISAPNGFTIQHVIQTDAPINPGNSGGPLLDAAGRVIGINSQIITGGAGNGNVGIGFAVPINTAKKLLPQLKQIGSVVHAYLGITGATIDASLADLQLKVDKGVLVQTVTADGPASRAGVRGGTIDSQLNGARIMLGGDVIRSFDGRRVDSMSDLTAEIAKHRPGDGVRLGILRSGDPKTLTVTLGTAPRVAPTQTQTP